MKSDSLMKKLVKWLDPKLERYREKEPEKKLVPRTEKELVDMIKNTPEKILSRREKNMIAAVMSFSARRVADLMVSKDEMTLVRENEVLGPLTLDKLYRSGFSHFPVVDAKGKIVGVIHTDTLNSLEIKEAKKAKELLDDKPVVFIKYDDSLDGVLDDFMQNNALLYAVVDERDNLVGMLTFEMVIYYLFGKI